MRTSTSDAWFAWPRAVSARVEAERLVVDLRDGRAISVPLTAFEFLANRTDRERQNLEIVELGAGIWWDGIDEGISVPGLFGLPEVPPPDPLTRTFVVDYRSDDGAWIAEVRGTEFSTFGRTLGSTKRRARELLRGYLGVKDLDAAGIDVIDDVHTPEAIRSR